MEKLEGKKTGDLVVVVDAKFCIPHPLHLILKPKTRVFQHTIFNVIDPNGGQLFRIENGDSMSNHEWIILDATDSPVATIRRRIFSSTWRVYRGKNTREEDSLASVKRQDELTLNVFLGSTVAKKKGRGDFDVVGFPPTIYKGDTMIADVNNNFSWGGDDSVKKGGFKVRVSAETDHVFIISLIMIYREMAKSISSTANGSSAAAAAAAAASNAAAASAAAASSGGSGC